MMNLRWGGPTATFVFGILFWQLVRQMDGVVEPWDSSGYWHAAYPISIITSGMIAWFFPRLWYAGAIITFAQFPALVAANNNPLIIIGLLYLFPLSLPAVAASVLAAQLRLR